MKNNSFCYIMKTENYNTKKGGTFMAKVDLNQKEMEVLKEILWSYLGDLRFEIADTDKKSWRDYLKPEFDSSRNTKNRLFLLINQLGHCQYFGVLLWNQPFKSTV